MKLLSIDNIPGQEIEALGMVKGAVVQTKHYGSAQVMQGAAEVLAYGTAVKIVGPAKEGTVRL